MGKKILALAGLIALAGGVQAANNGGPYTVCPAIADATDRLACYDSFSAPQEITDPAASEDAGASGTETDSLPRSIPNASNEEPLFGFGIDGLTNHEPNKLLARMDSNDINRLYMDATISIKHPVLSPAVDALASIFEIDETRNLPRLYFAFSGRFSQYIGSRESAPVVPRRYNPELFLRVWRDGGYARGNPAYWDFGYGHESNGQQISTEAAYLVAEETAVNNNEPAQYARDGISRGWDYLGIDWHKQWSTGFLPNLPGRTETHIEYRHYLEKGVFQGAPEEYNVWENDGDEAKTRDYYDGLRLSLQYNLRGRDCLAIVCFEKVELVHRTGYAKPFSHNTTSLEITTNIAGLPLHLWGRSGYNSDLIDYYDYTNSWGLGVEFNR